MKFYVTARKTVTVFALVVSAVSVIVIILVSIQPVSLPFLSSYFKDHLDDQFEGKHIDFTTVKMQWRPLKGNIELHFDTIYAVDDQHNNLANAPKLVVEIKANSIFDDIKKIKSIELYEPNISLIRSTEGVLLIDLGNTHNGSSNKFLELALAHVKNISKKSHHKKESKINLRLINSDLILSDEISGSLLHASNADINFSTNQDDIHCNYEFNVFASGEYINVIGDCSHNITTGKFKLAINLDKVRPSLLTEFFPIFSYFSPIEVQLSGMVEFEFDKLLQVNKTIFDLTSDNGTLEVIETLGSNLEIQSLGIRGSALKQFSYISIDLLSIALENNDIEANALFLNNNGILDLKFNALIQGISIADLLPRWFAYLKTEQLDCIDNDNTEYHHSSLSIDGIYDLQKNNINALGRFTCDQTLLSANTYSRPNPLDSGNNYDLNFRLDGELHAPNLSTVR